MLGRIVNKLRSSNRDVMILMVGTVVSQAIPVLASLILTTLFSPEDFGLFQIYFSLSMILSVAVTLRFEMAIMLPEKDEDARHLLALSCLLSLGFSVLILLLVFLFREPFSVWMKEPRLSESLFLLPFTLLVIGCYQGFNYYSNRLKYYKQLSFSRVARSLNSAVFSIGFGFFSFFKSFGLILGDTLGQAMSTIFIGWRTLRKHPDLFKGIKQEKMKELAKRYRQFPLFNVPSGLLEKLSGNLPSILLLPFYGSGMVGFLYLSQRMISLPGTVVARAIGDVFRQSAAEAFQREQQCKALFLRTFKKLSLLSIPPFVLLFFFVEDLFAFVFGEEWREAGKYAQILMPMFLIQFIVSPLSAMFLVAEKQKIDFLIQICLILGILSAIYGGHYFYNDPKITLILYSAVYSVKYVVEFFLSYKFSKGK